MAKTFGCPECGNKEGFILRTELTQILKQRFVGFIWPENWGMPIPDDAGMDDPMEEREEGDWEVLDYDRYECCACGIRFNVAEFGNAAERGLMWTELRGGRR
jgi:hypothetical protein